MGFSTNFQDGVKFYSLKLDKTIHRSKNDYTLAPSAGTISHVIKLAKGSPTGLTFADQLKNAYADDPENNTGPITIQFIDVPSDSQLDHDQQVAQEDAENMENGSLTNNNNIDPKCDKGIYGTVTAVLLSYY